MHKIHTARLGEMEEFISDLIALYGKNKKVVFVSNYGDIEKTSQLHEISCCGEEMAIIKTPYSQSGFAVIKKLEGEETETVIVIR